LPNAEFILDGGVLVSADVHDTRELVQNGAAARILEAGVVGGLIRRRMLQHEHRTRRELRAGLGQDSLVIGKGELAVAWFAVYDRNCAHALLSAKAPSVKSADVSALLVWHLIKSLSAHTKAFDFEGSMEPTLEYFYRSFGARQVPLMEVTRVGNPIFPLLLKLRR
jgi:hypothetical protein